MLRLPSLLHASLLQSTRLALWPCIVRVGRKENKRERKKFESTLRREGIVHFLSSIHLSLIRSSSPPISPSVHIPRPSYLYTLPPSSLSVLASFTASRENKRVENRILLHHKEPHSPLALQRDQQIPPPPSHAHNNTQHTHILILSFQITSILDPHTMYSPLLEAKVVILGSQGESLD